MEAAARRTRVAVVGYGYWGSKHVRVLTSLPGVELTVVDEQESHLAEAAEQYPSVRVSTSLHDVLDRVDGVVIATPAASHFRLALDALRAGTHALVEKPMTTAVADAERLVDVAENAGRVLMVGHTFEYNPAVRKLKEIVGSGALGRVLSVDTARLSLGRYQTDVNVIWDLAPHDISIVSYLLDEVPISATVWAQYNVGQPHADVAHLRLEFERAQTNAVVHVSWLSPNKVRRVTVVGERRMAVYDDMSDNERIRIYDIGVDPAEVDRAEAAHAMPVSYRTGDITSPYVPFDEPLRIQDRHFLECIRNGTMPDTSGRRGLDIVRVLAATDAALIAGSTAAVRGTQHLYGSEHRMVAS